MTVGTCFDNARDVGLVTQVIDMVGLAVPNILERSCAARVRLDSQQHRSIKNVASSYPEGLRI